LINRLPSRSRGSSTPLESLLNQKPTYSQLKVFGCACWPNLRPYNPTKLSYHSLQCVFLGYNPMHKGYKCLHPPTNRVYISRDVVFDEHVFPFATTVSSSPPPTIEHVLLPTLQPSTIPLPTDQHTDMPISSPMHDGSNPTSMSSGDVFRSQEPTTGPVSDMPSCSDPVSDALQSPAPLHGDTAAPTSSPSTDDTIPSMHPVQLEPKQDQRPRTRLRNNISKIKDFSHDIIR
jgi:hypothetical protein